MTAAEAMAKIEEPRFAALVNLASDLRTFLRIVGAQPEIQVLAREMKTEGVSAAVGKRIRALVAAPAEEGQEHPADAALAAYLWLLANQEKQLADSVSALIVTGQQFWWARKAAQTIRGGMPVVQDGAMPLPSPTPHSGPGDRA
jgi:hypothetical protein